MSPFDRAARVIARAAHAVVAEYRKLDEPGVEDRTEMSCTSVHTSANTRQPPYGYDNGATRPVTAQQPFGFGR
jgi:hypothetical protein